MNGNTSYWTKVFTIFVTYLHLSLPLNAASESTEEPRLIENLNIEKIQAGRHHFYFTASTNNVGVPILIPVIVIKGKKEGKKLLLTAGVHGDELNGIRTIHKLLNNIDYTNLNGAVIAIPGVNQSGLNSNSRYFTASSGGGSQSDLNRLFPGTKRNGNAASLYVSRIWDKIIKGRADIAIDLHTQTRGTEYPLFVFADFNNSFSKKIATLLMPDIIKNDGGENGTLETSLMREGVPAVTFEIGAPKIFQKALIDRAVEGIQNVMVHYDMLDGNIIKPKKPAIIGNGYKNIYAKKGGVVVVEKGLLDSVKKGELVATQYDLFGNKIMEYFSPIQGHVLSIATDPMREPGAMLIRILY
jgi:predicted deacylase